jgi:hypothetical protein
MIDPVPVSGLFEAHLTVSDLIGRGAMIGRRTIGSGLLVVAGGALIASTQ